MRASKKNACFTSHVIVKNVISIYTILGDFKRYKTDSAIKKFKNNNYIESHL